MGSVIEVFCWLGGPTIVMPAEVLAEEDEIPHDPAQFAAKFTKAEECLD